MHYETRQSLSRERVCVYHVDLLIYVGNADVVRGRHESHKLGRHRKFNCAPEIEFNFFPFGLAP